MYYVDVAKVRGKMAENGYTITSLAKDLGVSRSTLSAYLNNTKRMPYDIVSHMAELICADCDEAINIFFAQNLRKK